MIGYEFSANAITSFGSNLSPNSMICSPEKIAAVFCTMNRRQTALECVRFLSVQTVKLGKLIIADNNSSDDTIAALNEINSRIELAVEIIPLPENLGNAGGIRAAMDEAFRQGYEAVWILDDDSWPEPRALEELLAPGPPDGIRTSAIFAPGSDRLSWPCEVLGRTDEDWHLASNKLPPLAGNYTQVKRSWLGALIPRAAYEKVGPVNGSLFLRGEDEEYPRRLEKAGYAFWMMSGSILRHPESGPLLMLRIGGFKLSLEQDLQGDKLFYRVRNMLWIKKQETGVLSSYLLFGGYLWIAIRHLRPLSPALSVLFEAWTAAAVGRLGKRQGSA